MRTKLLILFLFMPIMAGAQVLKGLITNQAGEPISYSTVYIDQLKYGTTSNVKGEYEIKLSPGNYSISFQSLGFIPVFKEVRIDKDLTVLDVTLYIQSYMLEEVSITSTGEDPAYHIMRKAIGLAPYHLNQIEHYEADVYIKGSAVLHKLPGIVKRRMKKEDVEIEEGKSYLIESINKLSFEAPDIYKQTVLAQQNTFPVEDDGSVSPMDVIQASFYEPVVADIAISPLSPQAMSHYEFEYKGASLQGKYVIDKVSVIPKRKSQQLFSGTIYIVEDLWCIHSVDLTNSNIAGDVRIKQLYVAVQEDIWMPVSHNIEMNLSVVGVKGKAVYGSAITYTKVKANTNIYVPPVVSVQPPKDDELENLSSKQEQMEEILEQETLSNRDMGKLSKLMKEENRKAEEEDLEVHSTTSFDVEEDAAEKSRDFWEEMRPIPLSDEEIKGVRLSDSIKIVQGLKKPMTKEDSLIAEQAGASPFKNAVSDIFFGEEWDIEKGKFTFRHGGLIDLGNISFNPVDGFRYHMDMRLYKEFGEGGYFWIEPAAGWAFAREELFWDVNFKCLYQPLKQATLGFRLGSDTRDHNTNYGIGKGINSFASLLAKQNYMRLYKAFHFELTHRREYFNGFYLRLRYQYQEREQLDNNTDFSFFYRDRSYDPNIPNNILLAGYDVTPGIRLSDHTHHAFKADISYTPKQRYRIKKGRKYPVGSTYPRFRLFYTHGLNIMAGGERRDHDHVKLEINKRKDAGAFSEYSWKAGLGWIFDNDSLQFTDFKHFNAQSQPVSFTTHRHAFMLPGHYELSASHYYAELYLHYVTPYLLLKRLPVFSNSLMRENLSLAYMYSPHIGHYYEFGYSVSEIFLMGKLGVYAGFSDLDFNSVGIRFAFIFE